jgi:hypothetical protein
MSRLIGLTTDPSRIGLARRVTGSPVTADNTSLTDGNIPTTQSDTLGGAIQCRGFQTIWLGVAFTGGTNPTVTIDPLTRDEDAADGSRWVRLGFGTPAAPLTFVLDGTFFVEVRVEGRLTFPRISAVTSTPTQVDLLVLPGSTFGAGKGSTTAGS